MKTNKTTKVQALKKLQKHLDEKRHLVTFLTGTLIPDLQESGYDATAEDFQRCVRLLNDSQPSAFVTGPVLPEMVFVYTGTDSNSMRVVVGNSVVVNMHLDEDDLFNMMQFAAQRLDDLRRTKGLKLAPVGR